MSIEQNAASTWRKIKNKVTKREAENEQSSLDLRGGRISARWRYKKALRTISDYSSRISSVSYTAGNVLLTAKAGIHPDMDTVAGLLFNVTSVGLYFADKYPTTTYRVIGAVGLAGTSALSAKGINFDTGQVIDWWRVASPVTGFGVTSTLLMLQKEISQAAEKAKASKSPLKRAFASSQRYPVALAAIIDGIGVGGVGVSAVKSADLETLAVTGLWGVGSAALLMSDPRLRGRLRKYLGSSPERFKSVPAVEKQRECQGGIIFDSRQYNLQF